MLGEDIVLDISSVRAAKMRSKQNGKHTENNIPGCRVQIWHENRGSHDMLSDNASYISNDTVLSGPSKGKTRPRYDRLLIFFGRLEQYMSLFSKHPEQPFKICVLFPARDWADDAMQCQSRMTSNCKRPATYLCASCRGSIPEGICSALGAASEGTSLTAPRTPPASSLVQRLRL